MASVKTAVSLDESLWGRVQDLAREMQVSRSRLVALALEDFLRRRDNQELLERINATCDDQPDPEEEAWLRSILWHQQKILDEWS